MELKDKKIVFLGDSITEGVGCANFDDGYVGVLARTTGMDAKNFGISGTRIARNHGFRIDNPRFDLCFLDRVEDLDEDADCVVVFGGTNDFGHGDGGLGYFEDRDEYTFYGAMHSLISRLVNRFPGKKIVFLTPLHRLSEDKTVNEIGVICAPLKEYVKAMREVCEYYSIPVIDLYAESGLTPKIEILKERFMPDGLHPSELGAAWLADTIAAGLTRL